jgi:RNA polymerase sigma-70 factor (ECF subfamily)
MEQITDLVIKAQSGDIYAKEQLYMQTKNKSFYLALQLLKNNQDAEDVLQDAYITAFSKIDNAIPEKFQGWLDTIIINRAKDVLKKKKPMVFADLQSVDGKDYVPDDEETRTEFLPAENIDYHETKKLLQQIIDELPVEQSMAVILYYYKEMSVGQIAGYFECSTGTIKSRLNYARKAIKIKVEDLEKKGTKLYCIPVLPFLYWMFQSEAEKAVYDSPDMLQGIQHGIRNIMYTTSSEKVSNIGNYSAVISDGVSSVSHNLSGNIGNTTDEHGTDNQSAPECQEEFSEESSIEIENNNKNSHEHSKAKKGIETASSTLNKPNCRVSRPEGKNIAESTLHNAKIIGILSEKLMKSGFANSKRIIERGAISELIQLIVFSVVIVGGTIIGIIQSIIEKDVTAITMGVIFAGLMFLIMICFKMLRRRFNVLGAAIIGIIIADLVAIAVISFGWIGWLTFAVMGVGYWLYLIHKLKQIV